MIKKNRTRKITIIISYSQSLLCRFCWADPKYMTKSQHFTTQDQKQKKLKIN